VRRRAGTWPALESGLGLLMMLWAGIASAQGSTATAHIDFDRPEAWAMKYFTSASLLAPTGAQASGAAPQVGVGLDLIWLPRLSTAQQRVGFDGTAQEDLNQAPLLARPRLDVALSDRWTLTAAGLPPVHVFGITPRLLAVGVTWHATRGPRWALSAFGHMQAGSVTGAITCPEDVLRFAPGSDGNPRGCEAASADVTTLRYASVELDLGHPLNRTGHLTVHGSVGVTFVDDVFQTNAQTFGFLDRTRFASRGLASAFSLGVRYARGRFEVGGDVLYAPLTIRRPSESTSLDSLLTVRSLITYRIHQTVR
jgi:hypothetical protein